MKQTSIEFVVAGVCKDNVSKIEDKKAIFPLVVQNGQMNQVICPLAQITDLVTGYGNSFLLRLLSDQYFP